LPQFELAQAILQHGNLFIELGHEKAPLIGIDPILLAIEASTTQTQRTYTSVRPMQIS
jgi:hypothetical protein